MSRTSSPAARPADLRSIAYRRLKRRILTARLRPGSLLVERDLAAELKLSRTPVREAITRLLAEGLIVRRGRRGYLVAAMEAKEVADLYTVREELEALAVRLAITRMGSAARRQVEAVVAALARSAAAARDNRSGRRPGMQAHDLIVRHCGNRFLYDTWRRLIEKILPYVWIETLYADDAARTLSEHQTLCRYIGARNAAAAEKLIRAHIRRARDNLVRVLALQGGVSAPLDREPRKRWPLARSDNRVLQRGRL